MKLITLMAALTSIVDAQPAPTSYKIVQHHAPQQSEYATYYPRKNPFLSYTTRARQSFVDTAGQSIFG